MYTKILEQLEAGEDVELHPKGNSMTPLIKSGERILLTPTDTAKLGDVVLCKVKGRYFIHLVTAVDEEKGRWQISNNHGHVNGWTHNIYGRVSEIGDDG